MPVPTEMNVIEIAGAGGPDVLTSSRRPVPGPGRGEVLIEVHAAGVNRPDVLQRLGKYPPPPGASDLPGLEVAGVVVSTGDGVLWPRAGERVCALLAGRRIRRVRGGSRAPVPAPASRPLHDRGGRAAGVRVHGVGQRVRTRSPRACRRSAAGSRWDERDRHDRHPDGRVFRSPCDCDRRERREVRRRAPASAPSAPSTTARRTSSRCVVTSPADAASTWCSTWSAATTRPGTSRRWPRKADSSRSRSSSRRRSRSTCRASCGSG